MKAFFFGALIAIAAHFCNDIYITKWGSDSYSLGVEHTKLFVLVKFFGNHE